MNFLKKFFKSIFVMAIIALVAFSTYRYYKLKKEDKLKDVFSRSENTGNDFYYDYQETSNSSINSDSSEKNEDDKETTNNVSNEDKYVVEKQNYDGYYNQFNFDNRLLLYEGKQQSKGVKEAIDLLILDADDDMYSKPTVIFENFNLTTNKITSDNLDEYKYVLNSAKNTVGNSTCTISFKYNSLRTYVNTVVITKN